MTINDGVDESAAIEAAYEARVRELFLVMAEGLATGEEERRSKDRFRRALHFTRRARAVALEVAAEERQAASSDAA